MSRSVDLYSYDYKELVEGIKEYVHEEDTTLIEKAMNECGNVIGDKFVILSNEYAEDYSPMENMATAINYLYGVEDTFGEILLTFDDKFGYERLKSYSDTPEEITEKVHLES